MPPTARGINLNSNPLLVSQYRNMFSPNNIQNYIRNTNRNEAFANAYNNLNNTNNSLNNTITNTNSPSIINQNNSNSSNNLNTLPYKNVKKNIDTLILKENIQEGDEMVDFHDEHSYNVYYKKTEFDLLPNPKINPRTRKTIKPSNIKRYRAHLVGGVRTFNNDDTTPLINLIDKGDHDGLLKALQNGVDPNAESTSNGVTPLYVAVLKRNYKMIDALLKYGAYPYNPPEIMDLGGFKKNKKVKNLFIKHHPDDRNVFNQHLPSSPAPSSNIFNHNYPFSPAFENNIIVYYKKNSPIKKTIRKKNEISKKSVPKKANLTKKTRHFICKEKSKKGHFDCLEQ
jgi:hypothetical protein